MMEINLMGILIMTVVFVVVTIMILYSLGFEIRSALPERVREIVDWFNLAIFRRGSYNICKAYEGQQISLQEFQTLLLAVRNGQCENISASVTMSFSLTKDNIEDITKTLDLVEKEDLVFYREAEPMGAGALIIQGNPGTYPLKLWDQVQIWQEGYPEPDVLLEVTLQGCDPYDDDCDLMCSYKKGICDPLCYVDGQKEDVVCDLDCVDVNKNGKIDDGDFDDVCDIDCYNNIVNPGRAYDPDCVESKDDYGLSGICDPDSNGVEDGVCDPDCAEVNFLCDPDCDGIVDEGNPSGLRDDDCYTCDKTCNNFCAPVCTSDDEDPDCPNGYTGELIECCGNGVCGVGEDCSSCQEDCPSGIDTCETIFNGVCCPRGANEDYGCSSIKDLEEGRPCSCDNQCLDDLKCDRTDHCCPSGKTWNGTNCIVLDVWDIVYVPLNFGPDEFDSFRTQAQMAFDDWMAKSPFQECSDPENRIKAYFMDPSYCQTSCGSDYCGRCVSVAVDCARNYFRDVFGDPDGWDKLAGLNKRSAGSLIGCGPWTPGPGGPSSTTNYLYPRVVTHEVGHTLNLCHECGLARPSQCPNSNVYDNRYVMCYGSTQLFSPDTYSYLKGEFEFLGGKAQTAKFVEGC